MKGNWEERVVGRLAMSRLTSVLRALYDTRDHSQKPARHLLEIILRAPHNRTLGQVLAVGSVLTVSKSVAWPWPFG